MSIAESMVTEGGYLRIYRSGVVGNSLSGLRDQAGERDLLPQKQKPPNGCSPHILIQDWVLIKYGGKLGVNLVFIF